jgi:hypothetical protein
VFGPAPAPALAGWGGCNVPGLVAAAADPVAAAAAPAVAAAIPAAPGAGAPVAVAGTCSVSEPAPAPALAGWGGCNVATNRFATAANCCKYSMHVPWLYVVGTECNSSCMPLATLPHCAALTRSSADRSALASERARAGSPFLC